MPRRKHQEKRPVIDRREYEREVKEEKLNSGQPEERTEGQERGQSVDRTVEVWSDALHSGIEETAHQDNRQLVRAQNLPRDAISSSEKGDRPPRGSGIADMSPSNENRSLLPTDHVYSSRSQMERAMARDSEREHDGGSMNVTRGHEERQSDMEATDHVYSSQSQMERAMESEKQRERDATTTAGRRQAPESLENREASRGLDWEMRSEFERIRDDILGFWV